MRPSEDSRSRLVKLCIIVNILQLHPNGGMDSEPYYRLKNRLVTQQIAEEQSAKVIASAHVPIVKMRDVLTDIKVDISFNTKSGVTSVALIKEFRHQFPALEYLGMGVRYVKNGYGCVIIFKISESLTFPTNDSDHFL